MIIVCPHCGPESLAYTGRVVSIPCANCKRRIAEWENGTNKPQNYIDPRQESLGDGKQVYDVGPTHSFNITPSCVCPIETKQVGDTAHIIIRHLAGCKHLESLGDGGKGE